MKCLLGFLTLVVGALAGPGFAVAQAVVPQSGGDASGGAQIPLLDEEVCFAISEAKKLIATGDRELAGPGEGATGSAGAHRQAIDLLQRTQERIWGRNLLFSDATFEVSGATISVSACDHIISLLRGLPESAVETYRKRFEASARALYEHGLASQDAQRLVKCYEVYSLTSVAGDAALAAGDLFFEHGDESRAREAWNSIDPQLAEPPVWRERVRRGLLEAVRDRRPDVYDEWLLLAREAGIDSADVPAKPEAPPSRDPLADLPELPIPDRGKLVWQTDPPYNVYDQHRYEIVHYAQQPCVGEDWVTVSTLREVRRYDLESGKLIEKFGFRRFHYDREKDPLVRVRPVASGDLLVTSYVADANLEDDFFGYDIKISIPKRGLIAMPAKRFSKKWSTASRSYRKEKKSKDEELIEELSFNSVPVIVGDRLYALGWRQAGYVVSYLVCLDLTSGKPLWTTILAGNQVELTMFGELAVEPFLGEIHYENDMVYALTNLGAFAKVRARDGHLEWLTEYPAVEAAPARRQRRGRRFDWERNPLVSFSDRIIATPLDSEYAFAFHKPSGRMLQSTPSSRLGKMMLGRHGSSVVFVDRGGIVLTPARDLNSGVRRELEETRARPALVRNGVVYTSRSGYLCYRPFSPGKDRRVLHNSTSRRREFNSGMPTDGFVTVLADRILVTNSYQTRCFKAAEPDPPKENR